MKTEKLLRIALVLIVAGQLLGAIADSLARTLVEMPAWRRLGPEAWAAFSRNADLGNGRIMYPLVGIGGTLLILAAAIAFRLSPRRPLSVAIPLYGAALMAICVMLTTTQAAPIMLSLHRIGNDPATLQQAFEGFYRSGFDPSRLRSARGLRRDMGAGSATFRTGGDSGASARKPSLAREIVNSTAL